MNTELCIQLSFHILYALYNSICIVLFIKINYFLLCLLYNSLFIRLADIHRLSLKKVSFGEIILLQIFNTLYLITYISRMTELYSSVIYVYHF